MLFYFLVNCVNEMSFREFFYNMMEIDVFEINI